MKQYITYDQLHEIQLSDGDLFDTITDNAGKVLITPWVKQLFYEAVVHPRILFFDKDVDRDEAKRIGLISGNSSSYLKNMVTATGSNELFFIIWGIYSYTQKGLIVGYSLAQPKAILSLQRKKLIDGYLIDLE